MFVSQTFAKTLPFQSTSVWRYRGATAVEFAVVAPVTSMLILGLIDFGRALIMQHFLHDATRQGARVATLEGKTNSDVTTAVNAAMKTQSTTNMTATVTVNGAVANASTANPGDEIIVSISLPVSTFTGFSYSNYLTGSLIGVYSLRRE
jgi:Flp pilus assembly protein TadG